MFLSANKTLLNKLKKLLMDRFKMSDMGDVSRTLGLNVTRNRDKGSITISQKDYTEGYSATVWEAATPRTPPPEQGRNCP